MEAHTKFAHKLKMKTRATVTKRQTCEDCGKRFNKDSTFKKHMTTIHGVAEVEVRQQDINFNEVSGFCFYDDLCPASFLLSHTPLTALNLYQFPPGARNRCVAALDKIMGGGG